MPSPGDGCATCFFAFTVPQDAGRWAGLLTCNFNAPAAQGIDSAWIWPAVKEDYWCGEGINAVSGTPFNAAVTPISPTSASITTGTFTMSTATMATVTAAACATTSNVGVWWINYAATPAVPIAPTMVPTPAAGTFTAASTGGAVTGTLGFKIQN